MNASSTYIVELLDVGGKKLFCSVRIFSFERDYSTASLRRNRRSFFCSKMKKDYAEWANIYARVMVL